MQLERFEEVAHYPSCGLTISALRGIRKQSVEDVERLFSADMVKWMEQKGYAYEASYLRTVHGWRRACDERDLSELERSQLNDDFLDYILDDLMPWHHDEGFGDFSLLEVNRCVCVCACVCVCVCCVGGKDKKEEC